MIAQLLKSSVRSVIISDLVNGVGRATEILSVEH